MSHPEGSHSVPGEVCVLRNCTRYWCRGAAWRHSWHVNLSRGRRHPRARPVSSRPPPARRRALPATACRLGLLGEVPPARRWRRRQRGRPPTARSPCHVRFGFKLSNMSRRVFTGCAGVVPVPSTVNSFTPALALPARRCKYVALPQGPEHAPPPMHWPSRTAAGRHAHRGGG